jgi:hypothetical protein
MGNTPREIGSGDGKWVLIRELGRIKNVPKLVNA